MLRPFLLVCWLFSALALGFGSTPLAAQNPVKGVWTVTSVTQKNLAGQATEYTPAEPGLFIFTDRHFSRSVVFGPNLRKPFSERTTEAETIAAFTPVHMQAGTYELNGDRLTTHITVARNPAGPEGRQKVEHAVRIVGEFLYLTHTRLGAGLETIFKLRKVE